MPALRNKKFDRQYGAYLVGESKYSISRRLGVHRNVVYKAFNCRGFIRRPRWIVNEETRELIRILVATGDHTLQTIADAFGYKSYMSIIHIRDYRYE